VFSLIKKFCLQAILEMTEAKLKPFVGMSRKDRASYSIQRVIGSLCDHKPITDGIERELHDEVQRNTAQKSEGFFIPNDLFMLTRDLNVNTFGMGGAFVETSVSPDYIPLLRNKTLCERMGAQRLSGLGSNVAIPRQSGAATAYTLPEQATLTKSVQALDQVLLTPHRVGAYTSYTRQLVLQSSVDVEEFLRDDLLAVLNIKTDYLMLQGQGANSEPTGILNTTGVGSTTFGGAASWAEVLTFENALALANADGVPNARMGFITSPSVRNRWKQIAQTGTNITNNVYPKWLWERMSVEDGTGDGSVNSYRAGVTNQVLNNLVYFGNWRELVLGTFGQGVDLIVDPFTQATDATVRVTLNSFIDVAVRTAASFVISQDSGAQ
jgi:hypothetical protein